jgi:hypothetical protein
MPEMTGAKISSIVLITVMLFVIFKGDVHSGGLGVTSKPVEAVLQHECKSLAVADGMVAKLTPQMGWWPC